MDIIDKLYRLGERLRDPQGYLGQDSMLCQQAAEHIRGQERHIKELKSRLSEQRTQQRIASALEQAAMYGWGHVSGENLLDDAPAQPVGGDS